MTRSIPGLCEEVWGSEPPPSALGSLQSHLSRLHSLLDPSRPAGGPATVLHHVPSGYHLDVDAVATDVAGFEADIAEGKRAAARGDLASASTCLRRGIERWRGPLAQGIELGPVGAAAAARLRELHAEATEEVLLAELSLGRADRVAAELEGLVAARPERERLHGLRMLALYRAGRQAEALAAFQEARTQLIETLGVEPGPSLRRLHEQVLTQDPALDWASPQRASSRTLEASRTTPVSPPTAALGNLPAGFVDLVGRTADRRAVAQLLADHRLVTLTGAGGCGKTQLALAVGRDLASAGPDGVWLVELATREEEDEVPVALAEVLGVDDAPAEQLLDDLVVRLRDRRALLVLDNAEHVIDGVAELVRHLLGDAPQLRILVTSRQALDVDGERTWRVRSLSLPAPDADLAALERSEAGRLLLRRAREAQPDLVTDQEQVRALVAICRELDGIPLALELAAARLRVLAPEEVAARLDDRFSVLRSSRRGAPARHRTLEAAIGWSFDLLTPPARRLLTRLGIFAGGATLEAAELVCSDEDLPATDVLQLLQDLVDRNLVVTVAAPIGPARHTLLESIRSYALAHLDGDAGALRRRHAGYVADLCERAGTRITGTDQVRWLNRLHAEHDEVRAAVRWAAQAGDATLCARIVAGAWWFWLQFGRAREGLGWARRVLLTGEDLDPELRGRVTGAAGRLAALCGDPDEAVTWLTEARTAAADRDDAVGAARAEARLAQVLHLRGDVDAAHRLLGSARARVGAHGDPWTLASIADVSGHLAWSCGALDDAESAYETGEVAYLAAGDRWSACGSRLGRARVARERGDLDVAASHHAENLRVARDLTRSAFDYIGIARDLRGVAAIAAARDEPAVAARLLAAAEDLRTDGEVPLTPDERVEVESLQDAIAAALGRPAAVTELAAGRELGAAAALDAALDHVRAGAVELGPRPAHDPAVG
ncbi:ATP-binding protein [Nitriliruptor alkaliphilus]|uniref:ATP-binding protein n=1 Tax=Nitriliruptor alkaliphilus TaxID=427918 RepID=UPI0012EDD393|nr:BTAD domain-containing putative transcriptional regulator [Nitriliruptor alkaliphilus]